MINNSQESPQTNRNSTTDLSTAPSLQSSPPSDKLPMNWYKFLIYFSLFAGGILNIINSLQYFTGSLYLSEGLSADDLETLYALFPDLQNLNFFYGCFCVGLGIYCFFVRSLLKNFSEKGPKSLYLLYACNGLLPAMYNFISCAILNVDINTILPSSLGTLFGQGLLIFFNYLYFKKRAHLFADYDDLLVS